MDDVSMRDDVRQIREDVTLLVERTVRAAAILEGHTRDLDGLRTQMRIALMPIVFLKYLVGVCAGLGTVSGLAYGIIRAATSLLH